MDLAPHRPVTPRTWLAIAALVVMFCGAVALPASANPCTDSRLTARLASLASQHRLPVLYDGVAPLARRPARNVAFPTGVTNACVLLSATLVRRGDEYYVANAGQAITVGPGTHAGSRGRAIADLTAAATQVLREVVNQGVLPTAPRGDGNYLVAIPIWTAHPLYQRTLATPGNSAPAAAGAQTAPSSLRDRGWPDAQLLSDDDGLAVYLLAQRQHHLYFAVVRTVAPDEPLLDVVVTDRSGPTQRNYGPQTTRRFQERILPLIPPNAHRALIVEIWHYGRDVRLARQRDTRFGLAHKRHPLTGSEDVEVPMAVENWGARRHSATEPFTWWAGSEHFGVSALGRLQHIGPCEVLGFFRRGDPDEEEAV